MLIIGLLADTTNETPANVYIVLAFNKKRAEKISAFLRGHSQKTLAELQPMDLRNRIPNPNPYVAI